MITAEKCRMHAAKCKVLASSVDIPDQGSLEQSIMALNWEALADQIDHDNSQATEARLVALFAGLFRPLARISHRDKRIGAENQRKLFCENDFSMIRRRPRCRQSVAQNGLILESLKDGLWMQPSMPGW